MSARIVTREHLEAAELHALARLARSLGLRACTCGDAACRAMLEERVVLTLQAERLEKLNLEYLRSPLRLRV